MYQMTEREYRQLVCVCQGIMGAKSDDGEWALEHLAREMDSILYGISSQPRPGSPKWQRENLDPDTLDTVKNIERYKTQLTECVDAVIAKKPVKNKLISMAQQVLITSMVSDLPKRITKELTETT